MFGTKCTKLTKLRDRNYVYEIVTLAQLAGYYNSACSQCMKRYTEYRTVPRVSTVRIRNAVTLRLYSSEREMALHNVVPRVTTIPRGSAWCIICIIVLIKKDLIKLHGIVVVAYHDDVSMI